MHSLSDIAFWNNYAEAAQVLGGVATVAGAVVGILTILLVFWQVNANGRAARSTVALEAHRELLKLCIERPELSSSEAMKLHLKRADFVGILEAPLGFESERALWFLSYVLNTMEQVLDTNTNLRGVDEAWLSTLNALIGYHKDLLREVWPSWREHYGPSLQRLIDKALQMRPQHRVLPAPP